MKNRDRELREMLDNREQRIALAWMSIKHKEDKKIIKRSLRFPIVFTICLMFYVCVLLYMLFS